MKKEAYGKELIFISQINRDGSGTEDVDKSYLKMMQKEKFSIIRLSLTHQTFIASNFNSFVVKFKK